MASAAQAVRAQDLQGFKYFQLLQPLLARLHDHATARDKAGNRRLHFDQYAALVLFYFFNPILTSLKGLQQASDLAQVQKALGCARTSVGALSEAARVFDPALLEGVIAELAERVAPAARSAAVSGRSWTTGQTALARIRPRNELPASTMSWNSWYSA